MKYLHVCWLWQGHKSQDIRSSFLAQTSILVLCIEGIYISGEHGVKGKGAVCKLAPDCITCFIDGKQLHLDLPTNQNGVTMSYLVLCTTA